MIPSQLKELVEIWVETTTTNAVGTPTEEYAFLKQTFANVYVRSGGSEYAAEGTLPFSRVEFTLRYDPQINYKCKIKHDNQWYEINHLENIGRKHWIKATCVVFEDELSNG